MKYSRAFLQTLREPPAEAEIKSHQLLLRAGLARKLSAGVYTLLPAGLRVLHHIERIIREEMNRAGAIELLMPALQPAELWKRGPRYDAARQVMFTAQSATRRTSEETVLGPTHEEVVTDLVASVLASYRQLPLTLYQIQTKFRDEIRPRFGLMRGREFLMKDAYSFDCDSDRATASYQAMYNAYSRIFRRIGLHAFAVEADTGVMGGSFSHEFVVPCAVGESEIATTDDGSYAAAIEKAVSLASPRPHNPPPVPFEKFPTPNVTTIEDLTIKHGVAACCQVKTLVYIADSRPVLFLLRGDHVLNEAKVLAAGFSQIRPATPEEIVSMMGCPPGSLGALKPLPSSITRVIADECLRDQHGMTTGANEEGFHIRNISVPRDLHVDEYRDLRTALDGELHPTTRRPLRISRAIEVGHVFKLGTKYSEAFGARFLDTDGQSKPAFMGCYGIGVTRCLQAIIEQHHDENGIIWPASVAPWQVALLLLDESLHEMAEQLETQLESLGITVLVDDRAERPGVKFKDADLLGLPLRLTLGEKSLNSGGVELKLRAGKESTLVPVQEVPTQVQLVLNQLLTAS